MSTTHTPPQPIPPTPHAILVTAGPTHEPIDRVRYIANRSSGRAGIAIADHAAARGWATTLLLGPTHRETQHTSINTQRFQTTRDLQELLARHFPTCDILIMAAAVADFTPRHTKPLKLRRTPGPLTLELEPTPDLLAACASTRRPGQILVGFALEPADRLIETARDKLHRKNIDAIVANPLETMDADTIEATLITRTAEIPTPGPMSKTDFATWLLTRIEEFRLEN